VDEDSIESWDLIVNTNLRGQFLCMRAVLPFMVKQMSGSIISISSIGALGGGDVAPASYGASKAGVIALWYAAAQYGRFGIRGTASFRHAYHDLGMPDDAAGKEERLRFLEDWPPASFLWDALHRTS
jgi:hypothetical protein